MHALVGSETVVWGAVSNVAAAGLAWAVTAPALVVGARMAGEESAPARLGTATIVSLTFGAMALLASIPMVAFYVLASGWPVLGLVAHGLVIAGVGFSTAVVHRRVARRVGGSQLLHLAWLGLFGLLDLELALLMNVFPGVPA